MIKKQGIGIRSRTFINPFFDFRSSFNGMTCILRKMLVYHITSFSYAAHKISIYLCFFHSERVSLPSSRTYATLQFQGHAYAH